MASAGGRRRKDPEFSVTTCLPEAGRLKPGGFGSAVDFDPLWTAGALAEMDHMATDDHA